MQNRLTVDDLRQNAKSAYSMRLMAGAVRTIVAHESLCRAYKYKKDVAAATIRHDGKRWVFVRAYRDTCYAGKSVGGVSTVYPDTARAGIIDADLAEKNMSFSTAGVV
jgi:hypothetical protein